MREKWSLYPNRPFAFFSMPDENLEATSLRHVMLAWLLIATDYPMAAAVEKFRRLRDSPEATVRRRIF